MTTYHIDKTSNLLTVSCDMKLSELKRKLSKDALYFGYHPLDENDEALEFYFKRRTPNLYYFKYGSLSELTSTITVELKSGRHFHIKDAPRAAVGPDFNRIMIGSGGKIGNIHDVNLKITPLPERISCGVTMVSSRTEAQKFITTMVGLFIKPLFFKFFDFESAPKILVSRSRSKLPSDVLLFCLSGLDETVRVEEDVVRDYCRENRHEVRWLSIAESQECMNRHVFKNESYREIQKQYVEFLWTPSDDAQHSLLEKKIMESIMTGM